MVSSGRLGTAAINTEGQVGRRKRKSAQARPPREMDRNDSEYHVEGATGRALKKKKDKDNKMWWWIGGGVLVVGVIGYFWWKRRQSGRPGASRDGLRLPARPGPVLERK